MTKRIDKIFRDIKSLSEDDQREFLSFLPKQLKVKPEDLLWARLAESAFSFWDNPEDQVYDEL